MDGERLQYKCILLTGRALQNEAKVIVLFDLGPLLAAPEPHKLVHELVLHTRFTAGSCNWNCYEVLLLPTATA